MDGKSCFFAGHSDAPESVYPALAEAVERHITGYGVAEFRVGNYGGFDGFIYPEGMEEGPRRFAVSRLNRLMVQRADCIIAYVVHSWGGAFKTLERAGAR